MKPQSASDQKSSIQGIRLRVPSNKAKRRPGRPRRGEEKNPGVLPQKPRSNWSNKTRAYVKMVTEGKGNPWSSLEKKRLLKGLKMYSHQDWDNLCKLIPSRSKNEIQDYINYLRGGDNTKSIFTKPKDDAHLSWAPIESWLDMSTEMVHYEQTDLSNVLSRVFSVIGNFGCAQPTNPSDMVPDYGKLYRYIAAVMDESLSMPDLSPLESAIIADLMHGLGDHLRMSDTSLQRKVMCWKYKMLNHKFEFDDVRASLDRIRKALTNDFSDLQRDKNKGTVSSLPSFSQPPPSATNQSAPLATSASQSAVPVGAPGVVTATQPSEAPSSTLTQSGHNAHENTSASDNVSLESGPSTSTDRLPSGQQSADESEDQPTSKRGRRRIHDWRRPIEKPRLFTMNPFCVPIRLLRLKPLLTGASSEHVPPCATRQRAISVSSNRSIEDVDARKAAAVEEDSENRQAQQEIRQVTGLYVPAVARKNKRRNLPAPTQASTLTMNAISATLAKRNKDKEAPGASGLPAAVPKVVQVVNKGNNSISQPNRAFRCVSLPGGKMALVPMHLTNPAVLKQLPMKEARLPPRHVPVINAMPGVQNQKGPVQSSTGSSIGESVEGVSAEVHVSSGDTSGERDHVEEQLCSVQPTLIPNAHSSVSASPQPPSVGPSMQKGVLPHMSTPVVRQPVRQTSYQGQQGQNAQQLRPAQPGSSLKRSYAGAGLDCNSSQMVRSNQQKVTGPPGQIKQRRHTVPVKTAFTKRQIAQPKCITTTEIIVSPGNTELGKSPFHVTKSVHSRASQPYRQKSSYAEVMKFTQKKPSSTKALAQTLPKNTAVIPEPQQPQKVMSVSCVEPSHDVQSAFVTSGSVVSTQPQALVIRKETNPRKSTGDLSELSSPSAGSKTHKTVENGTSLIHGMDSSPHLQFSCPVKTYTHVPHSTVTSTLQGKGGQKTVSGSDSQGLYISSIQVQSHSEVSDSTQATSDQNKTAKPTFKNILFQVASPRTSSASTSTGNAETGLSDRVNDVRAEPDHTVEPCPSSPILSSPSHARQIKPTKRFVGKQKPQMTPPPVSSGRGRKKKTDMPRGNNKRKSATTSRAENSKLSARGTMKKAKGPKGESERKSNTKTRKQPSNFLAYEDISNMKVEIVTPEDARERLVVSEAGTAGIIEILTEKKRRMEEAQKNTRESVNLVMDNDEISLVSI